MYLIPYVSYVRTCFYFCIAWHSIAIATLLRDQNLQVFMLLKCSNTVLYKEHKTSILRGETDTQNRFRVKITSLPLYAPRGVQLHSAQRAFTATDKCYCSTIMRLHQEHTNNNLDQTLENEMNNRYSTIILRGRMLLNI